MLVSKEFSFEAAHYLTRYHGQCEHLHGHSYKLRVTVQGEIQENGLVIDFKILKKIVKERILDKYDHRCFNDFFENPTAEIIAQHFWDELKDLPKLLESEIEDPNLPQEIKRLLREEGAKKDVNKKIQLHEIQLWETPTSSVTIQAK